MILLLDEWPIEKKATCKISIHDLKVHIFVSIMLVNLQEGGLLRH